MTTKQRYEIEARLGQLGLGPYQVRAIRRIAMTLHRWYEGECGNVYGMITRDEVTGRPYWYQATHLYLDPYDPRAYHRIPDRETGAKRRLVTLLDGTGLTPYYQTDPRGPALYLLRPGDIPDGCTVDSYYTRGVAVY